MKRILIWTAGVFILTSIYAMGSVKPVFGRVEKVTLVEHGVVLKAKLDTGANTASLNAKHIRSYEKNGKTYLQFQIPNVSKTLWFHGEYVGEIRIKKRVDEKHAIKKAYKGLPLARPVIFMQIKLGGQTKNIRVNLTNRHHFTYPCF